MKDTTQNYLKLLKNFASAFRDTTILLLDFIFNFAKMSKFLHPPYFVSFNKFAIERNPIDSIIYFTEKKLSVFSLYFRSENYFIVFNLK